MARRARSRTLDDVADESFNPGGAIIAIAIWAGLGWWYFSRNPLFTPASYSPLNYDPGMNDPATMQNTPAFTPSYGPQ